MNQVWLRRAFVLAGVVLLSAMAAAVRAEGPIIIGQSASLSGTSAELGKQVKLGIDAYFTQINRAGGIHGRPLKLVTLDDRGAGPDAEANTKKLVAEHGAIALIGFTTRSATNAALPLLERYRLPLVGAATGAVHDNFNRYLFNVRASYKQEFAALIDYQVKIWGAKRIALVYVADDKQKLYEKMVSSILESYGQKLVGSVAVERTATEFGNEIQAMQKLDPDTILCAVTHKALSGYIREFRKTGRKVTWMSFSYDSDNLVRALDKEDAAGIIVSQAVPLPTKRAYRLVREYQQAIGQLDPTAVPSFYSLEGFIAAKVMVEGLRRAAKGNGLTGERLVRALESINNLDVGAFDVSFAENNHNGSRFVDISIVDRAQRFID